MEEEARQVSESSDNSEDSNSWEGEAAEKPLDFSPGDSLTLPVGVMKEGVNYRQVVIDEMTGIDDHLVSGKKAGGNGAKGMSLVICRCVQEVEGLLQKKKNPEKMFDRGLARAMTQPDRDFLITRIFMLSGRNETVMAGECPRCGRTWEEETLLSDLPVKEWPDETPRKIKFELEVGVPEKIPGGKETFHKKGFIRFPTGKEQELTGDMDNMASILDSMLSACITEIGTLKSLDQEQTKRLKRRDRESLMLTLQHELPGIKQWKEVKCQCGCLFDIKLDLASFFAGRRRRMRK